MIVLQTTFHNCLKFPHLCATFVCPNKMLTTRLQVKISKDPSFFKLIAYEVWVLPGWFRRQWCPICYRLFHESLSCDTDDHPRHLSPSSRGGFKVGSCVTFEVGFQVSDPSTPLNNRRKLRELVTSTINWVEEIVLRSRLPLLCPFVDYPFCDFVSALPGFVYIEVFHQ